MLENRGISFYIQWLGSVMQVFALVLAVGFASSAVASKKPCREGANFTPHCHIGDHAEETTDDWDVDYLWDITVELNFSNGDSTTSETFPDAEVSTHEGIVGKALDDSYVEYLCREYGDFLSAGRVEADVTFTKIETLFIDVHHHDHDGSILDPDDPDDHQHALIATCTEGGGKGGRKGRK